LPRLQVDRTTDARPQTISGNCSTCQLRTSPNSLHSRDDQRLFATVEDTGKPTTLQLQGFIPRVKKEFQNRLGFPAFVNIFKNGSIIMTSKDKLDV